MNEWWSSDQGALIGAIGGSIIGIMGGVLGSAAGIMARRARAKGIIVPAMFILTIVGAVCLATGLVALILRQPYHVFFPLLLGGGILFVIFGSTTPMVMGVYRQAESRRIEAEQFRRS